MDYDLRFVVWEITNACNMRCEHCGSSSGEPKPDELTTEEALDLCDQLGRLGVKEVTLSGGEPFVRKDWKLIARRLANRGVTVNAISNGWMLDEATIQEAIDAGMCNIGISIDGLEETHDSIRRKGSFARIMSALDIMKERGLPAATVSCLSKKNVQELPALKELLVEKGVEAWQLQLAEPMGSMLEHLEIVLKPQDMAPIVDFAYDVVREGKIEIEIADNLGYYDKKISDIRKICSGDEETDGGWYGCQAGISLIGIRCNGDISACLSIRDDSYIEGNIRESSLQEIWTRPGAFSWNRDERKPDLTGFCRTCHYAEECGAGCTGSRLTMSQSKTENKYCIYRVEMEKILNRVNEIDDVEEMIELGKELTRDEEFEVADVCLEKAIKLDSKNPRVLDLFGFVKYELGQYEECKRLNELALELDPKSPYAHKGLGLALAKLQRVDEGIEHLRKSVELASDDIVDYRYDLALTLGESGRIDEAIETLELAKKGAGDLDEKVKDLLRELRDRKTS